MALPRVAVYARYSSAQQRDTSIEDQVRGCTQFAERQGWTVDPALILTDYAVSGASTARGGFDQLCSLVRASEVDIILVENTDRLSRDLGDADRFFKQLAFAGIRLICFQDGIDTERKGARQAYAMKAMMADWFLDDLKDKTLRGLRGQATRGFHTGGSLFGYRTEPVGDAKKPEGYRILIDEGQAENVRRIFAEYAEGRSLDAIAQRLNESGVKAPRLGFWRKTTLREMLRNESYIGQWSFGTKEWRKDPATGKRRYRNRDASEVQRSDRPDLRIIDDELWARVQDRVSNNKALAGKASSVARARSTPSLLAGLLSCSKCGSSLVVNGKNYYRCSLMHAGGPCDVRSNLRADSLLEALEEELQRVLTTSSLRKVMEERVSARLAKLKDQSPNQTKDLEAKIAKLGTEVERLVTAVSMVDPSTAKPILDRLKVVTSEKSKAEAELESLKASESEEGPKLPTPEELIALMLDIRARLTQDPALGRQMLYTLFGGRPLRVEYLGDRAFGVSGSVLPWTLLSKPQKLKTPDVAGTPGVSRALLRGQDLNL